MSFLFHAMLWLVRIITLLLITLIQNYKINSKFNNKILLFYFVAFSSTEA